MIFQGFISKYDLFLKFINILMFETFLIYFHQISRLSNLLRSAHLGLQTEKDARKFILFIFWGNNEGKIRGTKCL